MKAGYKAVTVIVVIAAVAFALQGQLANNFTAEVAGGEPGLVERLKAFPEVEPYTSYPANITLLTEGNLPALAERQPAIYGGIPPGSYRVVFFYGQRGMLVIYSPVTDEVLRMFEMFSQLI